MTQPQLTLGADDTQSITRNVGDEMVFEVNNNNIMTLNGVTSADTLLLKTEQPILHLQNDIGSASAHSTIRLGISDSSFWDISGGISGSTDSFNLNIRKDNSNYLSIDNSSGLVTINNDLGISGETILNNLSVSGNAIINTLVIQNISLNNLLANEIGTTTLGVTENAIIDNNLTVNGLTDLDGMIASDIGTTILGVTGNATINGDLIVDTNTFVVDSSTDRVGIGITNPVNKLDVVGNIGITGNSEFVGNIDLNKEDSYFAIDSANLKRTGFVKQTGSETHLVAGSGINLLLGHVDTTSIADATGVTTQMVIEPDGDVGIGIDVPQRRLHVNSDAATTFIQLTNSSTGTTSANGGLIGMVGPEVNILNQESTGSINFFNSVPNKVMEINNDDEILTREIIPFVNDLYTIGTTALQFKDIRLSNYAVVGNRIGIGIGPINPANILDISASNLDIINFNASGSSNRLHIAIGDDDNEIQIGKAGAGSDFLLGVADGDAILRSNSNDLHFGVGVGSAPAITIDTSNNVGIGEINPNFKLNIHDDQTGFRGLNIRNNSVGTATAVRFQQNSDTAIGFLDTYSSTYTTLGGQRANGTGLFANGTGGLNLAAFNASGDIRFFTSSLTDERMIMNSSGEIRLGVSTHLYNSTGGLGNVVAGKLPMIELQRAGTDQTFTTGIITTVTYTSTSVNNGGFSEVGGTVTVPTNGVYSVNAQFTWASNSTGSREMIIIQNGTFDRVCEITANANSSTFHGMNGSCIVRITNQATQTLRLQASQSSGGNLNLISSNAALPTIFTIIRISDL